MNLEDKDKTNEQLINELVDLRHQVFELQKFIADSGISDSLQRTPVEVIRNMPNGILLAQLQQETARRKLAEQELNEQLLFSQRLIDTIPNPIFHKDNNGLYQGCNAAFEAAIGFSKEEIIGKSVFDLSPKCFADKYLEMDQLLLNKPGIQTYETSILHADGTLHDVIFNKATFIYKNNIIGILGVTNDITEHKKFEEVLQESEERYKRLVELSPDIIFIHSEGKVIFINKAGADFLGYNSPNEIVGKPFMDFIHPDNKEKVAERVQMMHTVGKTVPMFEEKYFNLKGEIIDVEVSAMAITLQGKLAVQVIARDITQRKRYEQALKSERLRLFFLLDSIPALIFLKAKDNSILFSNRYFLERFGKSDTRSCYEVFPGCEHPCKDCPLSLTFGNKDSLTITKTGSDGRYYQLNLNHFSDYETSSLVLIFGVDITEQKEAEKKLLAANQQVNDIIEFLPDATFVIDCDKKVIAWNRALEEMIGVPKEQVIGKGDNVYAISFYRQKVPLLIDHVIENDSNIMDDKYDFFERKGNKIIAEGYLPYIFNGKGGYVCGVASPLIDRSGKIVGAIETIRDITERKQAEASLRLSEERFYKVFNNSPVPMFIHSYPTNGRILYVNDSFVKFAGYQRDECIGQTPEELNLYENPEEIAKMTQLFIKQGFIRNLEIISRMKSGDLRVGLFSAEFINFDGKQCILMVIADITELKQFEKEILRLDRLDLIGEMAAGIGHEVRNPMTTVRGFLQILGTKEDTLKYKEYFDLMIGELDRANSIISEFLSLAKNMTREYQVMNLNSIVEALLPLIQADALRNDKLLNIELGKIIDLLLNEKEIRQLILNLVRNGLEAMTRKGNLTIRTLMDNQAVILVIQDQGTGIEPNVLEKLGTPFFTTKENGTGLGLAVCYSIAARHNAKIEIKSNSGGTAVFVHFRDGRPNKQITAPRQVDSADKC